MRVPGVCKRRLGESANVGASASVLKTIQRYDIRRGRWRSLVDIAGTSEKLLHFIRDIDTIVINNKFNSLWRQHLGAG